MWPIFSPGSRQSGPEPRLGTYRGWEQNPDNLRSGVSKACRYEPETNPTYQELATHYGTAVLPARKAKPRDKGLTSYCTSCVA
jgi:transposase